MKAEEAIQSLAESMCNLKKAFAPFPCGWAATHKMRCIDCYYKGEHSEMGATFNVCTRYSNLAEASEACRNSENCKFKITHQQVREAIEKQTPKKPELEYIDYLDVDTKITHCPSCGNSYVDETEKYCSDCGQALDWSGEEWNLNEL